MGKHAADKPHTPPKGGRLKHYLEIDREGAGPHLQTRALQERLRGERLDGRRAQEYIRIERGFSA